MPVFGMPTNVVRFIGSDDTVDITWDEVVARIGSKQEHFKIVGLMSRVDLWECLLTAEEEIYVPAGRLDEIDTYLLIWQDLPWVLESLPRRDFARVVAVADRCGFVLWRAQPTFPLAGELFTLEPKPGPATTAEATAGGWG